MRLTRRRLPLLVGVAALALALSLSRAFLRGADTQDAVSSATARIATLERTNTRTAREALTRQCRRTNLDRAEVHWRARLAPPGRIRPLLVQLHLPAQNADEYSEAAVERRLPILDCSPNLRGRAPTVLSRAAQRAFVADYAAGLIDPISGKR